MLPLAENDVIIGIFKYCVNINENLLGLRDIEIGTSATATSFGGMDVVMEETLVPRVTGHVGSTSLTDLILSSQNSNEQLETRCQLHHATIPGIQDASSMCKIPNYAS